MPKAPKMAAATPIQTPASYMSSALSKSRPNKFVANPFVTRPSSITGVTSLLGS